jgi:prepilin-type N-terminal cleavage/methylation domain-containing protein
MTLVEVMVVVAIVGILGAISSGFTIEMIKSSRVNASANTLSTMMATARQKAVTTSCAHFVEVRGPTWAAVVAGAPTGGGRVLVFRKGDCGSAVTSFEAGDRLVEEGYLGPDESSLRRTVRLRPDPGLVSSATLVGSAFAVFYDRLGRRSLSVDDNGDGAYDPNTNFDGVDLNMMMEETTAGSTTSTFQVRLRVPVANAARLN